MYNELSDYISQGLEFRYLDSVCTYYKCMDEKYHVYDFCLDLYNYQRRTGLDVMGAKIMALSNTADYVRNNLATNVGCKR